MNEALADELRAAFEGQFMQPVIYEEDYFAVDTVDAGTSYVPSDVPGNPPATPGVVYTDDDSSFERLAGALRDYVEGKQIVSIELKHGFLARLSASGYMDCTSWSAHESEDEAARCLIDMYGD